MKTATFKLVNEPAKPVQLFRGYSGEFEQGLVLFFALIVETFIFSRLYWSAQAPGTHVGVQKSKLNLHQMRGRAKWFAIFCHTFCHLVGKHTDVA